MLETRGGTDGTHSVFSIPRGTQDSPGLYFVGLHFLFAVSSEMIQGVGRDAQYVVRVIRDRLKNKNKSADRATDPVAAAACPAAFPSSFPSFVMMIFIFIVSF